MRTIALSLVSHSLFVAALLGQSRSGLQISIDTWSATASDASIPIEYWVDFNDPKSHSIQPSGVIGTGFLVDDEGHFVTAAHVLAVESFQTPQGPIKVRLTAGIRQGHGDTSAQPFKVVEIDANHDLALCQIEGFKVFPIGKDPIAKRPPSTEKCALSREEMEHPFASLEISDRPTHLGRLVLVSGFPLGSWMPTIQLGMISATRTIYPSIPSIGVGKDTGQMIQVSVSANHGNSGGPVIDLESGRVLGVILQLVPAPLQIQGHQILDSNTFSMSGIMLAAPGAWVEDLLKKHNLQSKAVRSGTHVIW